jgi:hypothetical protein
MILLFWKLNFTHGIFQYITQGGGDCWAAEPPPPIKIKKKKMQDSVDMVVSNALRDLHFSQNQPLKSADDQYTLILKNKIKNLESLT